jgi:hypothetical protein
MLPLNGRQLSEGAPPSRQGMDEHTVGLHAAPLEPFCAFAGCPVAGSGQMWSGWMGAPDRNGAPHADITAVLTAITSPLPAS